jgi:hypothetical protein
MEIDEMLHGSSRTLSRRELARLALTGALGASLSGWFPRFAQQAAQAAVPGAKRKKCILLWMDGGPSHIDTFDPKPDAEAEVRGEFKAIATSVPGIQICEKFPKLAGWMEHAALLRGMSTEEADHGRARIYMHTGYRPGLGGVNYPGLGSIISSELGQADFPLPNFVATGVPLNKYDFFTNPGYLGPRHQGLSHADPSQPLDNLLPLPSEEDFRDRAAVLAQLEGNFARTYKNPAAESHRTTFERAMQLMKSERCRAFDLNLEPAATREKYGNSRFGQGCLLARRLIEVGVPFVEVYLSNWDTHEKKSADAITASMPHLDQGMSALIGDLHEREMLDDTLIIWMGEFGRTPNTNRNGGRDHFAKAWSTVLMGGGIKGGQTIGKTDRTGASVVERPISVYDLMASVCKILGIDGGKEINTPVGRPIRLVDKSGVAIQELFG